MNTSTLPFQKGDCVTPCNPNHPWCDYQILVEDCYLEQGAWVIQVQVYIDTIFSTEVPASEFQSVTHH